MRKRRRLADKLTIFVCAVLVAVSAFFYAPMEVSADEVFEAFPVTYDELQNNYGIDVSSFQQDVTSGSSSQRYIFYIDLIDGYNFDFSPYMTDGDGFYNFTFDLTSTFSSSVPTSFLNLFTCINTSGDYGTCYQRGSWGTFDLLNDYTYSSEWTSIYVASDSPVVDFMFKGLAHWPSDPGSFSLGASFAISNIVVTKIASADSSDYQNGYNAGYSAGEQAGYGNGYFNGFADGEASVDTDSIYDEAFQAGKDSVDTESHYDAGYQAGYQVAYSEGYESGYDDGYADAMEYAMSLYGVDSEGFKDLGKTEKYGSGPYSGTWYLSDFYITSHIDPNPYISSSDKLYVYPTDRKGVVNFSQSQTLNLDFEKITGSAMVENLSSDLIKIDFDLAHSFDFDETVIGDEFSSDGGLNASFTLNSLEVIAFGESYSVSKFNHPSVIIRKPYPQAVLDADNFALKIGYSVTCWMTSYENPETSTHVDSSVLGHVYPEINLTIGNDDSTFSVTQFKSISDSDSHGIMNGFDSSQGNSVNSDLSSGLNDYQTSEDTLWATATTGLKDFTFFDFASVPAMITGMSFITAIMGSWFNQAGGASGVGIVLSILFSVVLVAMVLGLYRWYQSRGGKH